MLGLMQARGLLISSLIEHAALYHGPTEIVSRSLEGPIHRSSWKRVAQRARRVAAALDALGVASGARVATLAWNGFRHLELYFGVSGSGRVLHTVNPRLFVEQVEYIINHGEAPVVCFDISFAPLISGLAAKLPMVAHFVALTDRAHMPELDGVKLLCYEELIAEQPDELAWPEFDENTAATLCYTSGTTGNPKGVLYSHRSCVLHAFASVAADGFGLSARDSVLMVVPLFHVSAWGIPYGAAMSGAKLVLPGAKLDGESIWQLLTEEAVTMSAGIPTVWLNFSNMSKLVGRSLISQK